MNNTPKFENWQNLNTSEIIEDLMGKEFVCPIC